MNDNLEMLRQKIDAADAELLQIIARRQQIVAEIGAYKKTKGIVPLDEKRWQDVLHSRVTMGADLGFPADFVIRLYTVIHEHSLHIES